MIAVLSHVVLLGLAACCNGSGASRPLVVTDMPFGTCEGAPFEALKNAQRLMKVVRETMIAKVSRGQVTNTSCWSLLVCVVVVVVDERRVALTA